MKRFRVARICTVALLCALLAACATPYRTGDDVGVYSEVSAYRTAHVTYVDPLLYPFWSLDYFYYSRFYHPYSVLVHRFDPWYYPYPGWYYGYGHGYARAGHVGRRYVPWYRYPGYYGGYHPWRTGVHLSFGYRDHYGGGRYRDIDYPRVRQIDERLNVLETRQSLANRSRRPDRQLEPFTHPILPATSRSTADRREALRTRTVSDRDRSANRRAADRQVLLDRLRAAERRRTITVPAEERRRSTRPVERTTDPAREIRVQPRRDTLPRQRTEPQPPRRRSTAPPTQPSRQPVSPPPQRRTTPTRSPSRESTRPPRSATQPRTGRSAQQRARERER